MVNAIAAPILRCGWLQPHKSTEELAQPVVKRGRGGNKYAVEAQECVFLYLWFARRSSLGVRARNRATVYGEQTTSCSLNYKRSAAQRNALLSRRYKHGAPIPARAGAPRGAGVATPEPLPRDEKAAPRLRAG